MKLDMAQRMQHLPQQFFAGLTARVNQRIQDGYDVINLGQGNPDLPTPAHIVEALREAALDPRTHRYSAFTGMASLKHAVADFYLREYGVELDAQTEVAILFGGKAGLVEISEVYLNPGDVALVPDPGYPDYWSGIALAGAQMVKLPLLAQNRFLPDFNQIPKEIAQQAKLLFLNYPNNPTGAVAAPEWFEEVRDFAARHEILVVHDFAYGAIGFDGVKPASFLAAKGAKDVGIEIYTMSKSYNMAGWRIAFAVGNTDVIQAINLIQDHYYVSLFPAVQRAAAAALSGPQDAVQELVATYQRRRDAFLSELNTHGYTCEGEFCPAPKGSFYVWLRIPEGYHSVQFADALLEHASVGVAPGVGFGNHGEGYVRIALLAEEERLREAARRIAAFQSGLRSE